MQTASPSSADRPQRCGPAAPGRPQLRPAPVPEVTVDGVVVVLEPSRWRRSALRPLPSDAGSSPKDTQLSEQICASEHWQLMEFFVLKLHLGYFHHIEV